MKYFKTISLFLTQLLLFNCNGLRTNSGSYSAPSVSPESSEKKEFADLMEKDQIDKNKKTAEVLTYLLNDTDPADPYTVAVIENTSSCNIIVRLVAIKGNQIYNLPVPKNGKNHFKIGKATYTMRSNVCEAKYYSQKSITEPLILKLSAH